MMAGLGSVLNTARDALAAQSFGLSVTGQNIANATVPGYVRRDAVLQTRAVGGQTYGSVEIVGMRRATDLFAARRLYESAGLGSAAKEHERQLSQVEALFNDFQGSGLSDSIDALFGSFASLASNPADPSGRIGVLDRAEAFAARANDTANALVTQEADLLHQATEATRAVNERAQDLARVEKEIVLARGGGGDAADLLQEREALLRDLAEYVDIRVVENGEGGISVQASGATLVEGGRANSLSIDLDANGAIRLWGSMASGSKTEVTRYLTGGKLAGIKETRDVDIAQVKTKLDDLVHGIATAVNQQHRAGYGLDGETGRDLFDVSAVAQGAARSIKVSSDVLDDPDSIAAAGAATSLPGGSDNAIALVRLASSPILAGNTQSPGTAYGALISDIGLRSRRAQDTAEHRDSVHAQLENLFQSVSGVSLDEEMIQLSKFQRAFEASSKVITIVDQLLADLMRTI
jgi:flagellar hook-associated protein 1 FlgK